MSNLKIVMKNFNIMLGKCFNFNEIYDKLKLYKSNKKFKSSGLDSSILDINYLNENDSHRSRNEFFLKNKKYFKNDQDFLKKQLEYSFYDNTNFYNIYYNEMKKIKSLKKLMRNKKMKKFQINNKNDNNNNNNNNNKNNSTESINKNTFKSVINKSFFSDVNDNEKSNYSYEMKKYSNKDSCENVIYLHSSSRRSSSYNNIFFLENKHKLFYEDKFNIFLNQNNNIIMPNIKEEKDCLININDIYVNISSLNIKKSFKIIFYDLLVNITIDNIKELYKFYKVFSYNIYYASFYKNYFSFSKNLYIRPFLNKNKTFVEKSSEKLKIKNIYKDCVNKFENLKRNILDNKLKMLREKQSIKKKLEQKKYKNSSDSNIFYNSDYDYIKFHNINKKKINKNKKERQELIYTHNKNSDTLNNNSCSGSRKKENTLISENSKKYISYSNTNELFCLTKEKKNNVKDNLRTENSLKGKMYNLLKEKTIYQRKVEKKYINRNLNTIYTVRKKFLIQNINIYKNIVDSYTKIQEFIDMEYKNMKYFEIIHNLKKHYIHIELCKGNLYNLYKELFSIIRKVNNEKNIIRHGLIFLKLLNCFYTCNNKYLSNLFYYLFIFSKYNKFAYYLCKIQKYFHYNYFINLTSNINEFNICQSNTTNYYNYFQNFNNTNNIYPKERRNNENISILNNKISNRIINDNFSTNIEISENLKKEKIIKEIGVKKKGLTFFIISALLSLYKPYMYKYKKKNDKKNFKKQLSKSVDKLLHINNKDHKFLHKIKNKKERKKKEIDYISEMNTDEEAYNLDIEMENKFFKSPELINSNEFLKKLDNNYSYLYDKKSKKIKIKLKLYIRNICLKIHQLNKESILTLNLCDLNYYLFTSLNKYQFFFYNTKQKVIFYLNEKIKQIKFDDMHNIPTKSETNENIENKLELKNMWNELSGSESIIQSNVKRYKKKHRKNKNCIRISLKFKVVLRTYDNMYNIQDTIINPITFYFYIKERYKYFPYLLVHVYTTSININITTSFLYLCQYLYTNVNFKKDFVDVKNSNIEIYNDLHSEIIIFYKTRTKNDNYVWKLIIINKNEYHEFPCECLYFCINKKKEKNKINSEFYSMNKNSDDFIINNEYDLKNLFKDICKIGFKKRNIFNSLAKQEKHLLYDNTHNVYDILYKFTYNMPFLYKNYDNDNKIINIIKKKSSWIYIGVLYTDDLYSRAYKIPNVKYNLLVEPEIVRNKWCLCIGTCIQIENNSSLYFRIYKEGKTKYFPRVNFKWNLKKKKNLNDNYLTWDENNIDIKKDKLNKGRKSFRSSHKNFISYIEKKRKKRKKRIKDGDYINILPFSKRAIPLFWLYDCTLPYIKILRKKENKYNMKNLNNYNEDSLDIEAVPFNILYKLLNKYSLNNNNLYQKKLDIAPFELVFKSLIMFYCYVKVKDVPTQHIKETSYNYTIVIEPMVTIKNNLPNPITVIIRLKKEKGFFNLNKKKYEKKVEENFFYNNNYEIDDDLTKILKKKEMFALVPPHHYWCLPICTQAFYMKVFYHGLQIEKMNFICNYTNELKRYFDFKNIKLPDLNDVFFNSKINDAINEENINVRNGSYLNKEDYKNNINYINYRNKMLSYMNESNDLTYNEITNEFPNKPENSTIPIRNMNNSLYSTNTNKNFCHNTSSKNSNKKNKKSNNNFLYVTDGFFSIYMPSTDTITTTKILYHKYGLISNIFSYDELKFIYFENKINQTNRKIYDNLHIFKTITMSADVSRRKIDFYFPFFFENTTNVCICINNKILPPNSRLYMTEEEAKNIKIKSYKHDYINNKILCSNVSNKIDCTKTNMIRPLLNLVYRKINRKQKVRFWEKYEERKKKYINSRKGINTEEERNMYISKRKANSMKLESCKLNKLKDMNDDTNERRKTDNEFNNEIDKNNIKDNFIDFSNCIKEKNNNRMKAKLFTIHNENDMKNDTVARSDSLSDFYNNIINKNIFYNHNSKYTELSLDTNDEYSIQSNTKNTGKDKFYKKTFKKLLTNDNKLLKRKKKNNNNKKLLGTFDSIKKMKAFKLFNKNRERDKINRDELVEEMEEQSEGNNSVASSSYYADNNKILKKKKKNIIFNNKLYSLDKIGNKYFKREENMLNKNGNYSFYSENEGNKKKTSSYILSTNLFNIFNEEEIINDEEYDEGIFFENSSEQGKGEKNENTNNFNKENSFKKNSILNLNIMKKKKNVQNETKKKNLKKMKFNKNKYQENPSFNTNEKINRDNLKMSNIQNKKLNYIDCDLCESLTGSSASKYEKHEEEYISVNDDYLNSKMSYCKNMLNSNGNEKLINKGGKKKGEEDEDDDEEESEEKEEREKFKTKKKKEIFKDMLKIKNINKKKKIKIKKKDYYEGEFLSLGICVRYAEEPFNKSKIVTFVNSYIFINRLPFDVKIVTESIRKLDNIFISQRSANNLELNNKSEEKYQIEEKNTNKNIRSINSLNLLYEDKKMCEININNTNKIKENNKSEAYEENENLDSYDIRNNKIENNNNKQNYNTSSANFIENITNIERNNNLSKNKGSANSEYSQRTYGEVNNTKKSDVMLEINKKNETYIKRGEIASFHSLRSYIKIKDSNENYSSLPFSLIPKNVPSNFQIELFNINKSQINNINNLLVEINVCSGIFGDKQQLPYTYNGYFYILSLPVRPQFEIINATKFIIAYATDFNKYTRKYISNNYNTYLNKYNKNGNFSVKMIYPFSSIYYTLHHNNEIEASKIALKIVGVQKSSWCVNSINSFIDNVVVLPYSVYGDTLLRSRNNDIIENQSIFLNHGNYKNRESHKLFDRLSLKGNIMEIDNNIYNQEERKEKTEKENIFLGHNLVNKKLYSFLIIRDNGSRAIVITENYDVARKIVSTKNFSKIHKLIALNNRKKIILSSKNANKKYILDYKKKNFIYFNFPNVSVIYNFNVPRITFTWIHRQDVIIAVHLTKLQYSGHIYPKEIVDNDISEMFTPINVLKKKELGEYIQFVFLNSYIDSIFLIEQIHIDHFVKGDIPVILKNTNIKENEKEDIFLYIHIKQYCVDVFKQAPIYQSITIKISPINANIELLVIEQLIEIVEKEKQLLLLYEKKGKPLPPLIATSKTAKNAINTTLKIFSDTHFLQMLQMYNYIKDKMGNEFTLQNKQVINNNFLNSVNIRNENNLEIFGNKKKINESANIKPSVYSYYFSSPKARRVTQGKIINFKNILDLMYSEDTSISSNCSKLTYKNKEKILHKKICKVLVGYYKYKKINNLINNTYYNINNVNDDRLLPIEIQYFTNHKIFMKTFSSHLFLHPSPRWIDNKSKPVYIREFKIYPIEIIASIRTSEHRISRRILHIVDALPLDTPSMRIHLISQKRNYIVCTWDGLFQSLRISYFRQLLRQSLPSAWLSNPFAFIKGFIMGLCSLFKETIRGVKTSSNFFDGFMSGFKCGIIILVVNTVGGLFQSLSHMLNVCHKLMGGSRPRPPSILDSLILGFDGFILDTFYRPWVSLFTEPKISLNKGNSTFKTTCIVIGCILRCIFSPIFGLLNFFASLTEGFANTLIGDFERFSRVQERAEFETEKINKTFSTIKKRTFKRSKRKSIRYNNNT